MSSKYEVLCVSDNQHHPSVPSSKYDESYFLTACEGYAEYVESEGAHLSRRLSEAFDVAGVTPGMQILDVGCGRGEILLRCAQLGADGHGVDYAATAVRFSRQLADNRLAQRLTEHEALGAVKRGNIGVYQADAKHLPFPAGYFDRALMFDIVEHLYPWELQEALLEVHRVLVPHGLLIVHTAPNRWYDQYAYPVVRFARRLMGQGSHYPRDPRALNVAINTDVHVNEQDVLSLKRTLNQAGFEGRVWLDTPPQHRDEGWLLRAARHILFGWPPFRWFFEREVFAVVSKVSTAESPPLGEARRKSV
jgi:cyclopropane fatty-acyl-phospholipid synthase-like methyltransferase